jgi:hypothetical protein
MGIGHLAAGRQSKHGEDKRTASLLEGHGLLLITP